MRDETWELVNGHVADEVENLNRASLVNMTTALVKSSLLRGLAGTGPMPGEADLRLLHHSATALLLKRPGRYRQCAIHIEEDGAMVFCAQPWKTVKSLMREFFADLHTMWGTGDAIEIAAFALWRITWVHPFVNGNGRTAAAFAYACLCVKVGAFLPGNPTMLEQILADPDLLRSALRAADRDYSESRDVAHLDRLKECLDGLLLRQMNTNEPGGKDARLISDD